MRTVTTTSTIKVNRATASLLAPDARLGTVSAAGFPAYSGDVRVYCNERVRQESWWTVR
jgi:hypothetical protein